MILAYHFHNGKTLRDGRPLPKVGEWLVHDGPVTICKSGLHASKQPFDALQYAPGEWLDLVECDDIVDEQKDKFVCRRRRTIKRVDLTETLRYFARMQALSVVHLWDAPHVVLDYLMTGDESLRVATAHAARDASLAAAWDASLAAARDASLAAAWAAARDAARTAARAAARAAAWAAAWDAALAAARAEFAQLVDEAVERA